MRFLLTRKSYFIKVLPLVVTLFVIAGCSGGGGGGNSSDDGTSTGPTDSTPPETMLDSTPTAQSNSTTGSFSFSSSEAGSTFEVSVDGGAFASAASPFNTPVLAEGDHTFAVRATDVAGNVDATPAEFAWTIDITPPDTNLNSNPDATTESTDAAFTFSSPDATSTFEVSVDGGAYVAQTSPFNANGLAVGMHSFAVRAIDAAGNTDASPAEYTWEVLAPVTVSIVVIPVVDTAKNSITDLDASGSSASNGAPLTFTWTQTYGTDVTGGVGTLTGATPSFTSPLDVSTVLFDLEVDDGNGQQWNRWRAG